MPSPKHNRDTGLEARGDDRRLRVARREAFHRMKREASARLKELHQHQQENSHGHHETP